MGIMDKNGGWYDWIWFIWSIIIVLVILSSIGTCIVRESIQRDILRNELYERAYYDDYYNQLWARQHLQELEERQKQEAYKEQQQERLQQEYQNPQICSPNSKRCNGNWREKCNSDGSGWNKIEYCNYGCASYGEKCVIALLEKAGSSNNVYVSSVIDGDTIKLNTGDIVRLIGLNAPESGQKCYSKAKNKLSALVLGRDVELEKDIDSTDQYGRLLRYVYTDGMFVNMELVKEGVAHSYEYGSNTKYSIEFKQAEQQAKASGGCLWETSQESYVQDQCIYISAFNYDAPGNDNYNLNGEYVTFWNKCSYNVDMNGWSVKDNTASHLYIFPSFTLQSNSIVTLYTGQGTNSNYALYWGRSIGNYAAIWNNGGDTLFLRDDDGNLVLTQSY